MQLCRKGADALSSIDQAFQLECAKRPVDRHSTNAKFRDQFGFRGHKRAGWPQAGFELTFQVLLDALKRSHARASRSRAGWLSGLFLRHGRGFHVAMVTQFFPTCTNLSRQV